MHYLYVRTTKVANLYVHSKIATPLYPLELLIHLLHICGLSFLNFSCSAILLGHDLAVQIAFRNQLLQVWEYHVAMTWLFKWYSLPWPSSIPPAGPNKARPHTFILTGSSSASVLRSTCQPTTSSQTTPSSF